MENKAELKEFYNLMLSSLSKEAVPILRKAFFSIHDGQAVSEGHLVNQTGIELKTVK